MLTGQIVLVHCTGIVPAAISAFQALAKDGDKTDRRWNHAAVMVSETYCVGAEPGGAKLRRVEYFHDTHISDIPYTGHQAEQAAKFARDRIGTDYAYEDIGLIAVALGTGRSTPTWLASALDGDGRFICSELADAAVTSAGVKLLRDGRPHSAVYPAAIAQGLKLDGWW